VYWIRTVNDDFIYRGYFDEYFRATQYSAGYKNLCDLVNSDKGFGMTTTCLGMW
jgi:hypothetical protein